MATPKSDAARSGAGLSRRWVRAAGGLLQLLGRNATRFLAAGIFLGVLVPPLAAAARPLLTAAMFALIFVTVLRLDAAAVRASLGRPGLIALGVLWVLMGAPLLALPFAAAMGPGFFADHALLVAASAPVISAAAYALILGLDAAFALAVGLVATALVPFTLPLLAGVLLGVEVAIAPSALLLRLALLIGGAAGLAWMCRRLTGPSRLERGAGAIDGTAVLAMLIFGLAVMDGVTATVLAEPGFALRCLALVFVLAITMNLAATLVFARCGRRIAMTMGLLAGFKNFGVVVAAMGPEAADRTIVFLGLAQFPIYVLPLVLRPLAARWRGG